MHVYNSTAPPRQTIVMPDIRNAGGILHAGAIWCWNHGTWEPIPDDWRRREAELKEAVLNAFAIWRSDQECTPYLISISMTLTTAIADYCAYVSWPVPTGRNVRPDTFRLAETLQDTEKGYLVDVPRETSSDGST